MLLKLENIYFKYPGEVEVLKGANLLADRGEIVALIGPVGSGKTTLLMIAAGLLEPERGTVFLDGKPLKDQLPEARERIGLVFQNPDDQIFNPTVYDELAFALNQICNSATEVDSIVRRVADRFNITHLLNRPPYRLSMGEKRIVTLASIIIYNPDILLLDEPTANVSSRIVEIIKTVLFEFKQSKKAIVVASHDVEFIAEVSDRVYVINNGVTIGGLDSKTVLSDEKILAMADLKPTRINKI
jgi:cobalt/nickel transport system ATP-binding protein